MSWTQKLLISSATLYASGGSKKSSGGKLQVITNQIRRDNKGLKNFNSADDVDQANKVKREGVSPSLEKYLEPRKR
ncbi:hypothetical protein GOP47_0022950 [Adiantum capillus-veneris]|uniref:Uncharacterized protein n=1 Tax=Adiantum capillus-veneris TaxID=13818 RepID=A0A9D4Z7D2_ADICA|nr:hypothetical protein GOP47_0022950 [Adiantum capillus-veneris]